MEDIEKISGKKMFAILEKLKQDHTILYIHVMGTDFDGLTVILGLSESENPGFFIDYPGSAGVEAPIAKDKKCYFQFNDGERIGYSFKTTIKSIHGRRIKFPFPEYIERTQRRNYFRVAVPSGVTLSCRCADNQMTFQVINISEGGIQVESDINQHNKDILFKGQKFVGSSLLYGQEETPVNIKIDTSEIIRISKHVETGKIDLGLKILEIKKDDQNELKKFIYYCQRRVLKERGGFDE
ncbi:MAG: PilZ domain-containing protein [Desulfatiglans sp.]|mgnify:CR=1 FL=1|jgi:c-di-GMP-binding flagellar brake protein YcgR|nr:PilZ domain-containing protein [Desulfatiglans sp.]